MKSLCAIQPKNENKLFIKTLQKFKKKDILFNSLSLTNTTQTKSLSNFFSHYSPLKISKSQFKSLRKQEYLSYLNNKSKSEKDIKHLHNKTNASFSKQLTNYHTNDPLLNPISDTKASNKKKHIHNLDFSCFNGMVKKFNDEDYKKLTKRLIMSGTFGTFQNHKKKYPKKQMNQLVIHNIFLQGLMKEIKKEIDNRNNLKQYVSEQYICDLIKTEFRNKKLLKIKTKEKNKYSKTTKQANLKTEFINSLKFKKESEIENNEQCFNFRSRPFSSEINNNNCKNKYGSDNQKKLNINFGEVALIEEDGFIILPTKNDRIKNWQQKNNNHYITQEEINDNKSDKSLNEDLLNEYIYLNTHLQAEILNTNKETKNNCLSSNIIKQEKTNKKAKINNKIIKTSLKLVKENELKQCSNLKNKNNSQVNFDINEKKHLVNIKTKLINNSEKKKVNLFIDSNCINMNQLTSVKNKGLLVENIYRTTSNKKYKTRKINIHYIEFKPSI